MHLLTKKRETDIAAFFTTYRALKKKKRELARVRTDGCWWLLDYQVCWCLELLRFCGSITDHSFEKRLLP